MRLNWDPEQSYDAEDMIISMCWRLWESESVYDGVVRGWGGAEGAEELVYDSLVAWRPARSTFLFTLFEFGVLLFFQTHKSWDVYVRLKGICD